MAQSGRPYTVDPKIDTLRDDIHRGDMQAIKSTLKEFGINARDGDGRTALINSVFENKVDIIRWLIENGADVNIQDRGGFSALHAVAQEKLLEIGKILLKHHANLELRDRYGNTPLWTAVFNSRETLSIVKLFLKSGANPDNVNDAGRTPMQMLKTFFGDDLEKEMEKTSI